MNDYDFSSLAEGLKSFNIEVNERQIEQFLQYYELLIEWNSFMNLTSITQFEEVIRKHFVDSVSLVRVFPEIMKEEYTLIDVGTGAGFPGIPLKIVFPHLRVMLLDSLNKRISFLKEVAESIGLKDIEAVHGRAEDFARKEEFRERYDVCVSRAVANFSTLSEYCLPFVKRGGCFIAYKSEKAMEEYEQSKKAISIFGGKCERTEKFYLPDSDIYRNLFLIRKLKTTPERFPRKAGMPSKEPIFL